jgi:hypothetical protein
MTERPSTKRPEDEPPDARALELAAMSDLVATGSANNVTVTLARPSDPDESADLETLADRITAARGLFADIELTPSTITVRITRHDGPEGSPADG